MVGLVHMRWANLDWKWVNPIYHMLACIESTALGLEEPICLPQLWGCAPSIPPDPPPTPGGQQTHHPPYKPTIPSNPTNPLPSKTAGSQLPTPQYCLPLPTSWVAYTSFSAQLSALINSQECCSQFMVTQLKLKPGAANACIFPKVVVHVVSTTFNVKSSNEHI